MKIRRRPPNPAVEIKYLRYEVAFPDSKPRHILEEIVWHKEIEVDKMRQQTSLLELKNKVVSVSPPRNFLAALRQGKTQPAVIAEVKKASPSKGVIREEFDPVAIALSYERGAATCISVLTDKKFFQGSFENLAKVRATVDLPLLCKEFIIYPYQIYLARQYGADAVLLIAAILSDQDLKYFVKIVKALGMTPLVEVHNLEEMDRVLAIEGINLVGINNRNLENFSVNLDTTKALMEARSKQLRERDILVVSESGLHTPHDLNLVASAGADAVLIGESLMREASPDKAIGQLLGSEVANSV